MKDAAGSKGRIIQLDGLRGIAVLMVVSYHFVALQYDKIDKSTVSLVEKGLIGITSVTWSGVDLFFVLSGFLIGTILLENIQSANFFKTFYIRRFCRIIPIYYLLLLVFAVLKTTSFYQPDAFVFKDDIPLWYYFLFLQNFMMGFWSTFGPMAVSPTWSLAVEEQFYLIMPLLIRYVNEKYYKYIILIGIIMGPICRLITTNYYVGYTWLPCRINAPMIGFLLAVLHRNESFKASVRKHFMAIKFCSLLFLVFVGLSHVYFKAGALNHSLIGIAFGLILLIVLYTESGLLYKIMTNGVLVFTGGISYFLYLFHQVTNDLLHLVILHQKFPKMDSWYSFLVTLLSLAIIVLLGWVSFLYFERPLVRFGHKFKY